MIIPHEWTNTGEVSARWDDFFLARLEHLVSIHAPASNHFNANRLLSWAIYSTYLDCRQRGLAEEGREILVRAQMLVSSPTGVTTTDV